MRGTTNEKGQRTEHGRLGLCLAAVVICATIIHGKSLAHHVLGINDFYVRANMSDPNLTEADVCKCGYWVYVEWWATTNNGNFTIEIWQPGTPTSNESEDFYDDDDPGPLGIKIAEISHSSSGTYTDHNLFEVTDVDALSTGEHTIRAWVIETSTSPPNAWEYSDNTCTVNVVELVSVSETSTEVCVDSPVTFTGNSSGGTLACLEWQRQYRVDSGSGWGSWEPAGTGPTKVLNTDTPGQYQYQARNGDDTTCAPWKQSSIVDVVKVENVTFSDDPVCAGGTSTASATITPSTRDMTWSIQGNALGCSIDSDSGVITAGTTGGTITVRAADSNLPGCYAQDQITILAVTGIEINYSGSNWDDVTDETIVVLKGTKYDFKAIKTPGGASWPSGAPVWSGAASGTGETINVTFDTVGSQTLTAKCCSGGTGKQVTIKTVEPGPDEVSFVDNVAGEEHSIYGVTDPVWKRVSSPDNPASYTMDKKVKAEAKFWASDNLTYSTAIDVDVEGSGSFTFGDDGDVTFSSWPSGTTSHVSDGGLTNSIGSTMLTLTWKHKVDSPLGTGSWVTMASTSGAHKIYRVFAGPVCGSSNYTKENIDGAVAKATGESTESGIASKANDTVAEGVFSGCICSDGFQKNFDAAMGSYPSSGDKGMCCCRAKGLDCVLQVLGIGPYTQDFVNERTEPNPNRLRPANQYCSTCNATCKRLYWDGFWNNWEGVVKAGGTGSTCYAPAQGSISIDEGTYTQIRNAIATDCGFYWAYGSSLSDTCAHLAPP